MTPSATQLAFMLLLAAGTVAVGRWTVIRRLRSRRAAESEADGHVYSATYKAVVETLAKACAVDSKLIGPSTRLTDLAALDTWGLGEAEERLHELLATQFDIVGWAGNAVSVSDLVRLIDDQKKAKDR